MRGRSYGLNMPDYPTQYGPSAWPHTRELIGRELRKLYDVPTDLPPRLLALTRRLCRIETSSLPELPIRLQIAVMKLDELAGRGLLRRCRRE